MSTATKDQPTTADRSQAWLDTYVSIPTAIEEMSPGTSVYTIHKLCETGVIPSWKPLSRRYVKRADYLAYLAGATRGASSQPALRAHPGADLMRRGKAKGRAGARA